MAIRDMWVRGAPLIGATAAYGVALAMREDPSDAALDAARTKLGGDAADRDQPALGLGRHARQTAADPPSSARRRGLRRGAGHRRRGR